MNHRTHRNFAKLLVPSASWKMIDDVNSIIDNPSEQAALFSKALQQKVPDPKTGELKIINPFDVFGLGNKTSHRRINHDPLSSAVMTYKAHGVKGSVLGGLHVMMDAFSEEIKKSQGVVGRDLWEANVNYMLEKHILPQVIQRQKMISQATNSMVRSQYKRGNRKTGAFMSSRQNMHRTFIPTGKMAYY